VWTGPKASDRAVAAGRGKLLNRYYNIRRYMRNNGLILSKERSESSSATDDENAAALGKKIKGTFLL